MNKLFVIVCTCFLFFSTGCAVKKVELVDPLEGKVEIPKDLQQQIKEQADGDCNVENIIRAQLNIQLFQICQQACAMELGEEVVFKFENLARCVADCMNLHSLKEVECKEE